jgi:electron transfer flavoprotein beta subunit
VLVSDESYEGADTLGTARVLAAAINKVGDVQVAVFGRQAIDGDTGQTIVQTARKLGWTPLTFVAEIKALDPTNGSITVDRLVEEGRETITAPLPVVISVVKEINEPRYASFMGIRKANRAKIPVWLAADLALDGEAGAAASKADWSNIYTLPPRESEVEIIKGDSVEDQAQALVDRLFEEKVI